MNIRPATLNDLPAILAIYESARHYMREHGHLHQWTNGYPQAELLREDIALQHLYLCEENGEALGVFCYFVGEDPTYRVIYEGSWLNDLPYGVIHRIAVSAHRRGVASFCYDHCYARCNNLKIDTHRDNLPMQNSLAKNGFVKCGIIHLLSGDERMAYQKGILKK